MLSNTLPAITPITIVLIRLSKTVIPILNPYSNKSKSLSDIIPFSHRRCVILQAVFLNIRTYAVSYNQQAVQAGE